MHSFNTNCMVHNLHTSSNDAGHVQYENVSLQNRFQPVNIYISPGSIY